MKQESILRITITIFGRVQAVFFRRGVESQAVKLKLSGRVWNARDGTVGVIAEGARENLQKLLDWCYSGTLFAKVEKLSSSWEEATHEFSDFQILRKGTYIQDKLFAVRNFRERLNETDTLPQHVVIIPDGNRRWAHAHKLEASRGHEEGANNTLAILEESLRLKIPYITFWGFSTENWNRSEREIAFLMQLMRNFFSRLEGKLLEHKIRFRHFGRRDRLPQDIAHSLVALEEKTKDFLNHSFGLALDYGGRDEMIRAIKKIQDTNLEVSEKNISQALDTHGFPDPDFIIRTSGEKRLSGIMPWQGTYAELYFTDSLYPDFGVPQFQYALGDFKNRKRNFGK